MLEAAIAARLVELGLELPAQHPPRHPYLAAREDQGVLYLSGKTAMLDGAVQYRGPLLGPDDVELGRAAASLCALQLLAAIEQAAGLHRVQAILKLTVFVSSGPEFESQPEVANAASELLVSVLGPVGEHTRSAVGVAALPGASAVELEAVVRLKTEGAA